jgi:hypothetical protein
MHRGNQHLYSITPAERANGKAKHVEAEQLRSVEAPLAQ